MERKKNPTKKEPGKKGREDPSASPSDLPDDRERSLTQSPEGDGSPIEVEAIEIETDEGDGPLPPGSARPPSPASRNGRSYTVEVVDGEGTPIGTPKKKRSKKEPFDPEGKPYKGAAYLYAALLAAKAPHVVALEEKGKREPTIQEWADTFDKLNRLDKLEWEDIGAILGYLVKVDTFWIPRGNLQSAAKLREKDRSGVARWATFLAAARESAGTHTNRNRPVGGSTDGRKAKGAVDAPDLSGIRGLRK